MTPFYNPFAQQAYPPSPQQQNSLPPQQVLQANGEQSVKAVRMAPNSSVLIMDTTAPLVWLCMSDSLGNVTATAYDITPHEVPDAPQSELEARLAKVEKKLDSMISGMEGAINDESHAGGS